MTVANRRIVINRSANSTAAAHTFATYTLGHGQKLAIQGNVTNASWKVFATLEDPTDSGNGCTPAFVDVTPAGWSLSANSAGVSSFGNASGGANEIVDFGRLPIHQWYVVSTAASTTNAENFTALVHG